VDNRDVRAEIGIERGEKVVIIYIYPPESSVKKISIISLRVTITPRLENDLGAAMIRHDKEEGQIGLNSLSNISYAAPPSKRLVDWLKKGGIAVTCSDEEYQSLPEPEAVSLPSMAAGEYFQKLSSPPDYKPKISRRNRSK